MADDPRTIDDYLARLGPAQRAALQGLREMIHAAAPQAEECISYKIPAFRLNGMLVGFAAHKSHCALYAWNSTTIAEFEGDLAGFAISKGTIRFSPEKPVPPELVRRLVEAKVARNAERTRARRAKPNP